MCVCVCVRACVRVCVRPSVCVVGGNLTIYKHGLGCTYKRSRLIGAVLINIVKDFGRDSNTHCDCLEIGWQALT